MDQVGPAETVDKLDAFQSICPNISRKNHLITSVATRAYNCVAWVLGDEENWYEPTPSGQYAWPSVKNENYSLDAYIQMFSGQGFKVCKKEMFENGFQAIALYEKDGEFAHVAVRLPDGRWSSKLGTWEDIEHDTLEVLSGPLYGAPRAFMKRVQEDMPLL